MLIISTFKPRVNVKSVGFSLDTKCWVVGEHQKGFEWSAWNWRCVLDLENNSVGLLAGL